jgi:hypothetical protein
MTGQRRVPAMVRVVRSSEDAGSGPALASIARAVIGQQGVARRAVVTSACCAASRSDSSPVHGGSASAAAVACAAQFPASASSERLPLSAAWMRFPFFTSTRLYA